MTRQKAHDGEMRLKVFNDKHDGKKPSLHYMIHLEDVSILQIYQMIKQGQFNTYSHQV